MLRWQYSLSLSTGCIILDAQKLLELHSWPWQNHGSKCALPDVRMVALKCLFEKLLISHMHFNTIVHVWGVCFELPWFKKNAFSTFVYAWKRSVWYLYFKYTLLYVYIRLKAFMWKPCSKKHTCDFIRLYTFIYDNIRMQTPIWKFSRFPIYVYIRLYTFANACLEAIDISNMRLKNDYIRLKTQESNFQNFQIYEYIRLYTF